MKIIEEIKMKNRNLKTKELNNGGNSIIGMLMLLLTNISSVLMRHLYIDELMTLTDIESKGVLDKLHIHGPSIDDNYLEANFTKSTFSTKKGKPSYAEGYIYQHKSSGKRFTLFSRPWFQNVTHPYFIQINPNQFSSLDEIQKFLMEVMGVDSYKEHHLTRVDISILLPRRLFPVKLFKDTAYFKWKRGLIEHRSEYRAGLVSGYYSGKSKTLRISIYDVDTKNIQRYKKKTNCCQTNFEIQAFSGFLNKNEIRQVSDLPRIIKTNIFKRVSFFNTYLHRNTLGADQINKFVKVQEETVDGGFHNARYRLNKASGRNFNRDYKGVLRLFRIGIQQKSLRSVLEANFKRDFRRWCRGADTSLTDIRPVQ